MFSAFSLPNIGSGAAHIDNWEQEQIDGVPRKGCNLQRVGVVGRESSEGPGRQTLVTWPTLCQASTRNKAAGLPSVLVPDMEVAFTGQRTTDCLLFTPGKQWLWGGPSHPPNQLQWPCEAITADDCQQQNSNCPLPGDRRSPSGRISVGSPDLTPGKGQHQRGKASPTLTQKQQGQQPQWGRTLLMSHALY